MGGGNFYILKILFFFGGGGRTSFLFSLCCVTLFINTTRGRIPLWDILIDSIVLSEIWSLLISPTKFLHHLVSRRSSSMSLKWFLGSALVSVCSIPDVGASKPIACYVSLTWVVWVRLAWSRLLESDSIACEKERYDIVL